MNRVRGMNKPGKARFQCFIFAHIIRAMFLKELRASPQFPFKFTERKTNKEGET
jgi:hypothetical protein